ncbi:MAG: glycosyltransferase family 39 protein [Candidatus Kapabacteria bacterium]|nr:glycosyltransferase family 39 protein [Candidatus Kapabacteria bacterium]
MKSAIIFEMQKKDFVIILFLSSFIFRIAFVAIAGNYKNPDLVEHGIIAKNMLNGYGFAMHWLYPAMTGPNVEIQKLPPKYEGAFIPPLNPFIIYLFFKIFGDNSLSYLLLMILNSVFSSIFVIIIYFIAKEFTDEKTSRLSGIISLLFLPSIVGVTTFSGTALYQLLAGLVLLFAIKSYKQEKVQNFVLLGIFSGLLTLTRSEFLIFNFVIVLTILILLIKKKNIPNKKIVKNLAISVFIFGLIVSPWIIRNTLLFGQFTTIISHPWHELWRGNNPHSSGGASSEYQLNIWVRKHQYPEIIKKIDKLPYNQHFEIAVDSIFKEEVINYWIENPDKTINTWLKRALFTITIDPYTPRARNPIYIFFILLSIVSAFIGFRWVRKNHPEGDFSYLIYVSFLLSYLILISIVNLETRYQIYLVSLIHPFSAIGFVEIYNRIKNKQLKINLTKKSILSYILIFVAMIYLSLLYIDKEKEYKNFKKFENMNVAGRIDKIENKKEKIRVKLRNHNEWLEFHPGYIEDQINYPFLKTAKVGDSLYKESNAEILYLISGEKTLKYRYIIIYGKK